LQQILQSNIVEHGIRSRFSLAFSSSKLFRMVGDAAGEMVSTTPSFRRRFRMLRGDVDVGE
jgi:hypothetical protein